MCSENCISTHVIRTSFVIYTKLKSRSPLTKLHKKFKLEFVRKCVSFLSRWKDLIFQGEKKLMYSHFWYDLRNDKSPFSMCRRRFKGGSVRVRSGLTANEII